MFAVGRRSSIARRKHRRPSRRATLFEMLEQRLAMTKGTSGIFTYEATASEVAITGCDANAVVANIPASINGLPVTSISPGAFGWIEYSTPYPDKLVTVTIPDSVVSIGADAFYYSPITSITLPTGLQVIGDEAFAYSGLKDITLPAGLKAIGEDAFANSGLKKVTLPADVTAVASTAFSYCLGVSSIDVDPANPAYTSVDGVLCDKTGWVVECPEGKTGTFSIPTGFKGIYQSAFVGSSLTSVVIPDSVNAVGSLVFAYSSVKAITMPSSVTLLGYDAFEGTSGARIGFVGAPPTVENTPDGYEPPAGALVRYLASNAAWASYAGGKTFIGIPTTAVTVTAPQAVAVSVGDGNVVLNWNAATASDGTAISDYVVQYSSNGGTTWTTFNDGVSPVTQATVSGLTNGMAYVFRVAAKIDLGTGAFSSKSSAVTPGTFGIFKFVSNGVGVTITGCDPKATVAKIPASIGGAPVSAIGANAFKGCGSLTNVIVPSSVTSIGATPFSGCPKLVDLEFFGRPPTLLGGLTSGNPTIARYVKGDPNWSGYVGKEFGGLPTQGVELLSAPVAPSVVAGDRRVTLTIPGRSISTVARPGLVFDYDVQYSSNGGKTWNSFFHMFPLAISSKVTITGLTNGKSYLFRVAGINLAGTGDFSSTSAAVPAGLPGVPIGLKVTKGDGKVTASWLPAASNGSPITQYRIQYSANTGLATWGPWITSNQPATIFNQAVIGGLANGKTYRFRIAAVNAVGASEYSSPWVNATPGK